jgi:hypothetical protein
MNASYEIQWEKLLTNSPAIRYSVRVHPVPLGTWKLRPRNYEYEPTLVYWGMMPVSWAMMPVSDAQKPEENSHWTIWFGFRESPSLFLDRPYHVAQAIFVAPTRAPHHLMLPGFSFNLIVGPSGPVARAEVL